MFFKKKEKVLVVGGAGFIGSHLASALKAKGYGVAVVDDLSTGKKSNLPRKVKFFKYDVRGQKLEKIFKKYKITHVFHLAAQINLRESVSDPINDARINILGTLNLLELCRRYKIKKFIFSSTGGAIYGDTKNIPTPETHLAAPVSPYGVAKLSVEKYLHYYNTVFGLDYIVLRYANVYGPKQNNQAEAGVVSIFCDSILRDKEIKIFGDGKQTRDFVYVADVVSANLAAMKSKKIGIYNVATSKETSVNQLLSLIADNFKDKQIDAEHIEAVKGEQRRSCLDYKKIKKDLAWQPKVTLEKGIKLTADWFSSNYKK